MASVFISYETTTGLEFAKHLQRALKKHDISSFVARVDILLGEDPLQSMRRNLEECRFFVPILTITALKSEEVKKEFLLAGEMGKHIIPCIKEGLQDRIEKEFKEILDLQHATFENKEDLANAVVETVLNEEISHHKNSLRRLKETISREDLVDQLVGELNSIRDEIYFWLTEPDVDPNQQYIVRKRKEVVERRKKEELQKIKKEIVDRGFPLMA